LLGAVGCDNETQAQLVSGKLNYARISTGDLVRDRIEADTELGRELKGYSDRGEPVPDEMIMELVRPHLQPAGAWILDACPCTIEQARMLDEELKDRSGGLDHVIVLDGHSSEELIGADRADHQQQATLLSHRQGVPPRARPSPGLGRRRGPRAVRAARGRHRSGHLAADRDLLRGGQGYQGPLRRTGDLTVVDTDQDPQKVTEDIIEALGNPQRR
jgi:adenylate kinase